MTKLMQHLLVILLAVWYCFCRLAAGCGRSRSDSNLLGCVMQDDEVARQCRCQGCMLHTMQARLRVVHMHMLLTVVHVGCCLLIKPNLTVPLIHDWNLT